MSYTLFSNSPFSYSPVSNKEQITALGPEKESEVLKDIFRMLDIQINGKNVMELRMQEKLSEPQQKIYALDERTIPTLSVDEIKQLVRTITSSNPHESEKINSILQCDSDAVAQQHLNEYKEDFLKPKIKLNTLDEFKDFLKVNLLNTVKDENKREYLAKTIASGYHQSGYPRAANSYFNDRVKKVYETNKNNASTVHLDPAPITTVNITCKNDTVTINENLKFHTVMVETKYNPRDTVLGNGKHTIKYSYHTDPFMSPEGKPLAEVESKIHIRAGTSRFNLRSGTKSKTQNFVVSLQGDPLHIHINKISKTDMPNDQSRRLANNALTEIFDPRSSMRKLLDYLAEKLFSSKPTLATKPINSKQVEEKKSEAPKEDASPRPR